VFVDGIAAGLTPGFFAGRDGADPSRHFTPASRPLAPIDPAGRPTPHLAPVARLATFAASFERVLAAIDWGAEQPVAAAPEAGESVVSLRGELGGVVFLFPQARSASSTLVLPDGRAVEVATRGLPALPLLVGVRLGARATLEYSTFPALASIGESLVCYGPPGARGVISIDGAELETAAPTGDAPAIVEHAGVTVVLLNADQAAGAELNEDSVVLPGAGLTLRRTGIAPAVAAPGSAAKAGRAPRLGAWSSAADPAVSDDDGWIPIDAPARLADLPPETGGADGYRWLRCRFTAGKPARGSLGFLDLNDRARVWLDGEPLGVVGDGPDTRTRAAAVALGKGEHTLTLLVDHLGRPDSGGMIGEPVGLTGPPRFVAALRLNKPRLVPAAPVHPARELPARVWDLHDEDAADPHRVEWRFTYRRASPLHLRVESFPVHALAILNDRAFVWLSPGDSACVALPSDARRRGGNTLQFAVEGDARRAAPAIARAVTVYESKSDLPGAPVWSARAWAPPDPERFDARRAAGPAWHRAVFTHGPEDAPIALVPVGLRKGAALVNSRVLGRTLHPPRSRAKPAPIPVPPSWLRRDEPNELLIFDETGAGPASCRLVTV